MNQSPSSFYKLTKEYIHVVFSLVILLVTKKNKNILDLNWKSYPGSFGVFSSLLLSSRAGATFEVGGNRNSIVACKSTPVD